MVCEFELGHKQQKQSGSFVVRKVKEGLVWFHDTSTTAGHSMPTPIYTYMLTIHIYPTPPLGQDMTQGQFLSGV